MQVTKLSAQVRDPDRVNVFIDDKFRCSLDIQQVVDLGLRVGSELDQAGLEEIEQASKFGKLYVQTLEYIALRPRSEREVRDYLFRKTLARAVKGRDGAVRRRDGVESSVTELVLARLIDRYYIDDVRFTTWWIENRNLKKGVSKRRLQMELRAKGVAVEIINQVLDDSLTRDDMTEIAKVIKRKVGRYPDRQKLRQYLFGQGFSLDIIDQALEQYDAE